MLDIPVVLILFRRPELTARVFEAIAAARPRRLLLVADAPRPDRPEEVEACRAAREVVARVDWDCEVIRDFAEEHLGCGRRPASGLDHAFSRYDSAIVLEDDCVPHPSFFRFCSELLERYADDRRVMQVCGHDFRFERPRGQHSYRFSRYNICAGGWATWRRAWRLADMRIAAWPELRETDWLDDLHANAGDDEAVEFWTRIFDRAHAAGADADYWDYQWTFACWANGGLSVVPERTLLTNVGFGPGATHTHSGGDIRADRPLEAMGFPLEHPSVMVRDIVADREFWERVVAPRTPSRPTEPGPLQRLPESLKRPLRWLRDVFRQPGSATTPRDRESPARTRPSRRRPEPGSRR